jgi:hypothetical protein
MIPKIKDLRPFVICTPDNYEPCKRFFLDLGFEILWDGENVCEFATGFGDQRFMLTLHIMDKPVNAGVLHFWVENVDEWHAYVKDLKLEEKDYDCKIAEPAVAKWGWRIMYVWAPSGLLMHFAEPHSDENKKFFNSASWIRQ